ncbi:hypothetical protein KY345_05865 [Candidatus Woesearchaeota archaeon]|nr:hypothetical protein [Candidatus Woesearchaeota archaeon]
MDIFELAKESKDILKPFGQTDVLLYYGLVVPSLSKYLKGKEIAAKNWLGKGAFSPFILKRGSKLRELKAEYFTEVSAEMLKIRKEKLDAARKKLSDKQQLLWEYFIPRKLSDLFYATNSEGAGKPIERIFIDIDRGTAGQKITQRVTKTLVEEIKSDKMFLDKYKGELFVMWTGNSFHVYVFLDKHITINDYEKNIAYTKKDPLASFIGRWAQKLNNKLGVKVLGSHEKVANAIILDPSQTPSGKLCRAPFSLHMANENKVDGVSVPLSLDMLDDNGLVMDLKRLKLKDVVEDLREFTKRLPKRFR